MGQGGQSGWGGQVGGMVRWSGGTSGLGSQSGQGCSAWMFCIPENIWFAKKKEKSSHVVRTRPPCTDIHVKLDRFPPRFHHCLAELEHGKCYIN